MKEPILDRNLNRPRLRTLGPDDSERHASWLELFFDLVFVLAVAQVARILAAHSDADGFLKYVALFVPVWWAWIGFSFYADRFETEEAAYRVLMFAGMLGVIGLSLTLGGAFTATGDVPFIICYVLVRMILVTLYVRAAYYVPLARPYCNQFIFGLSLSAVALLLSLLVEPPLRYAIWAASLALEFVTPFINITATRLIPIDRSHVPERLGLFTIIVLGEAVIATAMGAASVAWNVASVTMASLGFALAAGIWWINFDFVEDNAIRSNSLVRRFIYLYGHFFIVASIVAAGVGVEHAIKESGEAHLHTATLALIAGGMAVYLAVVTGVRMITGVCNLVSVRIAAIAVSLIIALLGQFLPPLAVMGSWFVAMIAAIWVETRFSPEHEKETEAELSAHLIPCEHAGEVHTHEPRSENSCEQCRKNNYKWVHLRLCLSCGHTGCCDSSVHKHATKHFHETGHPIMASLETGEHWAWCYEDERFVPLHKHVSRLPEVSSTSAP